MSLVQTGGRIGVVGLIHKILASIRKVGLLVVLDMAYSCKTFRLIGIYAPYARKILSDYYWHLENFLMTSKTLAILGHYNAILDARLDSSGSTDRYVNSRLNDLFMHFQLVDLYRIGHTSVPVWTWINGDRRFKV